jgi:5'-deoxynucleotidase YfbR-like HD superfamily hydrolase
MNESEDNLVRLDARLSGQILRYHTWPILGQQTIAEHSWHLMRIYLAVATEIDPSMVRHITFHDIGETEVGDAPFPVKHDNPQLKEQMDTIELKSQLRQLYFWDSFKQVLLNDQDKILFKQIELVEMAEFGLDQVCLGNSHGLIVANRCLRAVYEQKPCVRLVEYVIKRLELFFKQSRFRITSGMINKEWWDPKDWDMNHLREEKTNVSQ